MPGTATSLATSGGHHRKRGRPRTSVQGGPRSSARQELDWIADGNRHVSTSRDPRQLAEEVVGTRSALFRLDKFGEAQKGELAALPFSGRFSATGRRLRETLGLADKLKVAEEYHHRFAMARLWNAVEGSDVDTASASANLSRAEEAMSEAKQLRREVRLLWTLSLGSVANLQGGLSGDIGQHQTGTMAMMRLKGDLSEIAVLIADHNQQVGLLGMEGLIIPQVPAVEKRRFSSWGEIRHDIGRLRQTLEQLSALSESLGDQINTLESSIPRITEQRETRIRSVIDWLLHDVATALR